MEGLTTMPSAASCAWRRRHRVACSTVNSYKGLVSRVGGLEGGTVTWAPTHLTFGANNRSATFRLPQNRYCIENRASDMCMNAYLGLA